MGYETPAGFHRPHPWEELTLNSMATRLFERLDSVSVSTRNGCVSQPKGWARIRLSRRNRVAANGRSVIDGICQSGPPGRKTKQRDKAKGSGCTFHHLQNVV